MKVTIIIPVFNISNYIERCLNSVIRQTYKDIECIIVDDASQDDSIIICEKIISAYKGSIEFSLLHHSHNRGLSAARNTGTTSATGDYIYYLDGDDELTPTCIETLMTPVLVDNCIEMVEGNYVRCTTSCEAISVRHYSPRRVMSNDDAYLQYFKCHTINIGAWNKLLKRLFVVDHQLLFREGVIYEDYMWSFYLIKYLQNAFILSDVTYYYKERPDSIVKSTSAQIKAQNFACVYNEIFHNLTPTFEKVQLIFYVEGFCRRYMSYKSYNMEYDNLIKVYQNKAKKYGCWMVYIKLVISDMLSRFKYGLLFLSLLRGMRNNIIRRVYK